MTLRFLRLRFLGLRSSCAALLWCATFALAACAGGQTGEEDPVPQCLADADCSGGACIGSRCVPADELCVTTDDCEAGFVCHYSKYHCPYGPSESEQDCPAGSRGLCTQVQADCSADDECADDHLCWAVARFDCAPTDPACDAAEPGICSAWGRFCELDETHVCAGEETCIDRRCTWMDATDEHDEIALDGAKNDALEPIWRKTRADDEARGGSCSVVPGGSTPLAPLVLFAALATILWFERALKRRSATSRQ